MVSNVKRLNFTFCSPYFVEFLNVAGRTSWTFKSLQVLQETSKKWTYSLSFSGIGIDLITLIMFSSVFTYQFGPCLYNKETRVVVGTVRLGGGVAGDKFRLEQVALTGVKLPVSLTVPAHD